MKIRTLPQKGLNKLNYGILAVLSILSSFSTLTQSPMAWAQVLLSNSIAIAVCALWFWYANARLFSSVDIANWRIFMFALVIGAIKGGITGIALYYFGATLSLSDSVATRIPAAIVIAMLVIPTLEYLENVRLGFDLERASLIASSVRRNLLLGVSRNSGRVNQLQGILQELRIQLVAAESNSVKDFNFAGVLRGTIENLVRPLSHELWREANRRYSNFSLLALMRLAFTRNKYSVVMLIFIYSVASIFSLIPYVPLTEAFTRTLIASGILAIAASVSKLYKTRTFVSGLIFEFCVYMVTTGLVIYVSDNLFGPIKDLSTLPTGLAVFLLLIELRILFGVVSSAKEIRRQNSLELASLQSDQEIERVSRRYWDIFENRRLANLMHGEVQNRLLAAAIRYENDQATLTQLVKELDDVIEVAKGNENVFDRASLSLEDQLSKLRSTWDGFIEIDVKVSDGFELKDPITEFELNLAIEEAIGNAVRHGLASKVEVSIEGFEDLVTLKVTDNGVGLRAGAPGLGTGLFNSIADLGWSISNQSDGGTTLQLKISLS